MGLKKPITWNLLFVLIAISVAKTFRINEIASHLPFLVDRKKSKQKRFLRFFDTCLPIDALKRAWFVGVVSWFARDAGDDLFFLSLTAFLTHRLNNINHILHTKKIG